MAAAFKSHQSSTGDLGQRGALAKGTDPILVAGPWILTIYFLTRLFKRKK